MTRFHSVRFRITLVAVVVLAVVLTLAGASLLLVQRSQLLGNLDASLSRRADDVTSLLSTLDGPPRVLASEAGEDTVVQIIGPDGRVVGGTANAVELAPIADVPVGRETARTLDALPIEDDSYRLLSKRVETDLGTVVVHVAENTDDVDDVNRALLLALGIVVPASVAVLSALVWVLVGRALRPVEALRTEVSDIDGGDLHTRVSQPDTGDEIERLAETMNSMLDRIEEASERQQRFVADASHELRSPLTRIRTELEVDLAAPHVADLEATHQSVLAEAAGLSSLVDDLLLLARSGPDAPMRTEAVDLDDIVLREARRLRAEGATLDLSDVSGAAVTGDEGQLVRVVRNLLDNAVRHAESQVTVALREVAGRVRLDVADDGPGVPATQAERIFERFTRLDAARSRTDGGTGLGLAIVREIVERHGGRVWLDVSDAPGATFVVDLPSHRV